MIKEKAIIVAVKNKQNNPYFEESLEELKDLLAFLNVELKFVVTQKTNYVNPSTLIGKGKIQEIKTLAEHLEANLIVFLNHLTPTQFRNLEKSFGNLKIIDRVALILDIFAQRAKTIEGKLQVELAQLNYLLPRTVGYGRMLSRLGGGIGTRGPGEKKLTVEKRKILKRINYIKNKLKEIQKNRDIQRKSRTYSGYPIVTIVGYTNAGKSTLFNLLTKSDVMISEKPFTTLDPKTGLCYIDKELKILVTDTVGFVRDLPQELMEAFKATFEELSYSDLLILIFDISNPNFETHIQETKKLIDEVGATSIPSISVFNKIDKVDKNFLLKVKERYPNFLFISAKTKENIDILKRTIKNELKIKYFKC
ncbi:MAG: GTPase HflX [bacterium]